MHQSSSRRRNTIPSESETSTCMTSVCAAFTPALLPPLCRLLHQLPPCSQRLRCRSPSALLQPRTGHPARVWLRSAHVPWGVPAAEPAAAHCRPSGAQPPAPSAGCCSTGRPMACKLAANALIQLRGTSEAQGVGDIERTEGRSTIAGTAHGSLPTEPWRPRAVGPRAACRAAGRAPAGRAARSALSAGCGAALPKAREGL